MATDLSRRAASLSASILLAVPAACGEDGSPPEITTASVWHQDVVLTPAGPDLASAAPAYLRSLDGELELALSSADDWEVLSITQASGLRVARLRQTHDGVPVFGAEVAVRADASTFLSLSGYATGNLDGFDITTTVDRDEAIDRAAAGLDGPVSTDAAELVILPGRDLAGADLAWQVELSRAGSGSAGSWVVLVGARDGAVLRSWSSLETFDQASGPGGNERVPRQWQEKLDVVPDGADFKMETPRQVTRDAAAGGRVVTGPLASMPDKDANDAHGFTEITLDMMRGMGHDSVDDRGLQIVSSVHDNAACKESTQACWTGGGEVHFGDGGDSFGWGSLYPLPGALDVVAHEINHGFTAFHSRLIYTGMAGGMNESFSDVAGTCAEFHGEPDSADFDIAENITKGRPLRYLCDPTSDYHSVLDGGAIDDAADYRDGMNPHQTSGVGNRAFCLAVARYRASSHYDRFNSVHIVGRVWYDANSSYWTSNITYTDACQGVMDAARAAGFSSDELAGLAASWADVGVICDHFAYTCDADHSCDVEDGETCAGCPDDCGPCSEECGPFKWDKCDLGLDDCSRCDRPVACGDGACDGSESDASCGEDCGCGAVDDCSVFAPAPFGCYCDPDCHESGDCCADVDVCTI